jgi:alpha-amylase
MDYETFGEHQWPETGIFNFMKQLPSEHLKHPDNDFKTPSEVSNANAPVAVFDSPGFISWADMERDISAWMGNKMQESAARELYLLEGPVKRAYESTGDGQLLRDWRLLQTSDHFYYMCTKWFSDGDVHKYFNPYETPYEAYMYFMNILNDIKWRISSTKRLAKF